MGKLNNRFVWEDGDFTITDPEPGSPPPEPPKGPFDPNMVGLDDAPKKPAKKILLDELLEKTGE